MAISSKMEAIVDALRLHNPDVPEKPTFDRILSEVADMLGIEGFTEYEPERVEVPDEYKYFDPEASEYVAHPSTIKRITKLTTLANMLREATGKSSSELLSLDDMASAIRVISDIEAKIGKGYYGTFEDALTAAKDGDTVTLLKEVSLGATVVLDKSVAIDGNGHKIKTTFNNYLFNLKTTTKGAFLKLMNVDVTHSHMVANVDSGYYADITIENATFTGLYHFVYFRGGSAGSLKINKVTADMGGTAICVLSGSNDVSIIDSTITAAGHAVQVEHSGSTVIEGSTVQSSQKDFTIVYRAPDSATTLTIKNSTVENNSTDDGLGVALWAPYGRGGVILSGDAFLTGKIDMLSKVFPTLDFDYSGYGFMVRNDGTCFYFCETLGDAISKCEEYDAAVMYAITWSARMEALNAECNVTLDSATGYYVVS